MYRVYVLVEDGNKEPRVDGDYDFEIVPRVGEYFTIGSLGKDAIFQVTGVMHHATSASERLQSIHRLEIKTLKAK